MTSTLFVFVKSVRLLTTTFEDFERFLTTSSVSQYLFGSGNDIYRNFQGSYLIRQLSELRTCLCNFQKGLILLNLAGNSLVKW